MDYWLRLCGYIQSAADSGNVMAMGEGLKKAFCSCVSKVAPLKSASGNHALLCQEVLKSKQEVTLPLHFLHQLNNGGSERRKKHLLQNYRWPGNEKQQGRNGN
ncbi:hypothetical protein RRG08_005122 [Elysia crispata]|uniref:Uncharacterized protein n=1 Tax=Elysia crispata TaxID=231223 RepID=A0AAE1DLG0_9GAST|nr:hypothetical protein RRG08_005122 [Elysia crispata]